MTPGHQQREIEDSFNVRFGHELAAVEQQLGVAAGASSMDMIFLAFLRSVARFGYFTLGPITVDVRLIEDIVERAPQATGEAAFTRFSQLLMTEVRASGRARIDELHYLLAFMRCDEGLPARVFSELGVQPAQLEAHLKGAAAPESPIGEELLTPEEVAEYLKVHVQTVRTWIRSGRLPGRRIATTRALRVRAVDVQRMLRPIEEEADDALPD